MNTGSATDVVRLTPAAVPAGAVQVLNDLIDLAPGEVRTVTVHVDGSNCFPVTLSVASEGDLSRTARATAPC